MIKSIPELFLLMWFFLGICGCQLNLSTSEMGYCFDAGLDEVQNRLYIAAGKAGIHTLGVDQGRLTFISTFYDAGYYRNLIIHNGTAYVADTDRGLVVLDITGDIPKPVWVQGENQGTGIAIEHNLLYLSTVDGNLDIFDISLPRLPKLIQQVDNFDQPWDVWVFDGIAYVADVNKGVEIIDVSMPNAPQRIGSISWDPEEPMAEVIAGEAGFIYIAAGKHGLVVIDVINPAHPKIASIYRPNPSSYAEGVSVRESQIYLAVGDQQKADENGLHILEATNPYDLHLMAKVPFDDWVEGVFAAGDFVYITNTYSGVRSIQIDDPEHAFLVGHFAHVP